MRTEMVTGDTGESPAPARVARKIADLEAPTGMERKVESARLLLACIFVWGCRSRQEAARREQHEHGKPEASLTEKQRYQIEAERWLLRDNKTFEEKVRKILTDEKERKYVAAYREIIKPGYPFLTSNDPMTQTRILTRAMRWSYAGLEHRHILFHWAKDPRRIVRQSAFSAIYRLVHGSARDADAVYPDMLEYLESDLPAEYLAKGMQRAVFMFCNRPVPESVLKHFEEKAGEQSEAGRYLVKAVKMTRNNGKRLPSIDDVGRYPPLEIKEVPLLPEPEVILE